MTKDQFRYLPYHRLRGIEIDIEAAESNNPAQIYAMWRETKKLVECLSWNTRPLLHIRLTENNACWTSRRLLPCFSNSRERGYL